MAPKPNENSKESLLTATYISPSATEQFQHSIASPRNAETAAKIDFLSDLRTSTKRLQDEINTFLTVKMEEDKINVSVNGTGAGGDKNKGAAEREAEEIYGEEKEDDD